MARFGYTLYCEGTPPRDLVAQAVMAEEAGFDFAVISDHYHPWLTSQEHSAFAWSVLGAVAQAPRENASPAVPVEVTQAVRRLVPVRIEVLGSVTPIASVAVKARVDTEITAVHFRDGALVQQGDLLFTLDSRAIEAQVRQVEGLLAGARANLEQAERDVGRYTELLAKSATTLVTLQNARTQTNIWRASVDSNTAQLENLNIQISYCTIRAPISGRAAPCRSPLA